MNRIFKTLLLWLLVAVLPLHAVGASMPMSCTPAHHQAMQKAMQDSGHQGHAMHHQQDAGMSLHDSYADAGQMHHATSDHGTADGSASNAHPHAGCSACSAGCIGAAAPPLAWDTTPTFRGSEAVLLTPLPLVVGSPSTDLERPPKSLLV